MNTLCSWSALALGATLTTAAVVTPATFAAPLVPDSKIEVKAAGVNELGGILDLEVESENGLVEGEFMYITSSGFTYGGTLDCVFVDGGSAYVSGEITFSDGPPVGWGFAIRLRDFDGAPDDMGTPFFLNGGPIPGLCENPGFRAFYDANVPGVATFVEGGVEIEVEDD